MKYKKACKNIYINKIELQNYFINVSKAISLEDNWEKNNALEIEIKKSFIRGIIRYSTFSLNIAKSLKEFVLQNLNESQSLKWITLPYPMIHLVNDEVEASGGFHFDSNTNKKFYTLWTQITDYNYPGLSLLNWNNTLTTLFSKALIKLRWISFFSKNLKTDQDKIYYWDAKKIHKGNFNSSKNKTCAIQLKVSEDIYEYEQLQDLMNKSKNGTDDFINYSEERLLEIFNNYKKVVNSLINNNHQVDPLILASKLSLNFDKKHMPLSFGISVLAQRLSTCNNLFKIKNIMEKVNTLDMLSLLTGSSNLISLSRLLINYEKDSDQLIIELKKIDKFRCIPYESCQLKKIVKSKIYKSFKQFNY